MGEYLFVTMFGTLFLFIGVELFAKWYRRFLSKRQLPDYVKRAIEQIMWVLLAFLSWNALYRNFLPEEFDISHLLFGLFIFSLRGLVMSLFERREAA